MSGIWLDGDRSSGPLNDNLASWNRITPGYFEAVAMPMAFGRDISERDTASAPHVAVVNESFAKTFFGTSNPVGRYFGPNATTRRAFEVVGVVSDARFFTRGLDQPTGPSDRDWLVWRDGVQRQAPHQ